MKFTLEQFKEISSDEDCVLYLDDLPLELSILESCKLFNLLPTNLQGCAISWGVCDSVFRDDLFVWVIQNVYGIEDHKKWYENFDENYGNPLYQTINWEELELTVKTP